MNKKISLGAAIAFMLIVAAATFSMTMIYSQRAFNERVSNLKKREVMYDKFTEIDRQIRENYIGNINETTLMDSVAQGYVQGIDDKYAKYISAEEYAKLTSQNDSNENAGIGAVLEANPDGYLVVKEVYPDSPAQVRGLLPGDLIVTIDGEDLTVDNVSVLRSNIYGGQGSQVVLTVRRGGEEHIMDLTRRTVVTPTVYANMLPETDTAYIYIKEFSANTSDQFNRELDKMISAGAKTLIFDLRDNKGGVMRQATRILDKLVPAGVIYTAQRKDGTLEHVSSDANAIDLPMAVLTNGNTASAAELFAQVLKDYDKARTVGTLTAGKGVMQEIIKLSDGSAIDLTVAYYNPPVSSNYDGVGIKPDFEVTMEADWTTLNQEYDPQIKKALEVVVAMRKAIETARAQESAKEAASEADESSSNNPENGESSSK